MPRLVEPELEQVLAFCAEDPVERVFLEDMARRGMGRFTGLVSGAGLITGTGPAAGKGRANAEKLVALCHVGANLVPSGRGCGAFAGAARNGRARMIIGEEGAVTELWKEAVDSFPAPREDRPGQPVFRLDQAPEPGDTRLRSATLDDLDLLVPAAARTHLEEIGIDPLRRDPDGFRWRTRAQIEEGRSWLWDENGTILFKAEASAWTPSAVQIQQVWVDPEVRGRGYAQRGMRDLCRLLLASTPTVCLFARPENAPALRVYEAIGMQRTITYRSLLF